MWQILSNYRGAPRGTGTVELIKFYCLSVGRGTAVMRAEMEAILKETFRDLALKLRYDRKITQYMMAEALVMSERSYEDIECGRSACGALTICLLLMECEDANEFLADLRVKFDEVYSSAEVSV